ncbi:MAG: sulfate adenylyltransferase subunit CysD [archaeon]|nr:MAG: sulfate adenylyltransferase subunit CysD [archaeon]
MDKFVQRSVSVIREAKASYKNIGVLFSTGKDSVCLLDLIRKSFPGGVVPFKVIHLDTGEKFPEIYEFRDMIAKKWNLDMIVSRNEEGMKETSPDKPFECCMKRKTENLKKVVEKYKFDALMLGIRRDEHYIRNLERYFSPRDKTMQWHIVRPKTEEEKREGDSDFVYQQNVELSGWNLFQTDFLDAHHIRIHPILHWTEIDVWEYVRDQKLPINPLYFAKNGKRYRSLGCKPCTKPIDSNASTIDEIIEELQTKKGEEREGRCQDKEQIMRKLRALGYC